MAQRVLPVLILAVAAWFLLKVVLGVLTSIATGLAVIVAIVAVVWAVNRL